MSRATQSLLALLASGCAAGAPLTSSGSTQEAARGATASGFDRDAFYTISTVVDGAEVALTFILPEGVSRGTLTTNPSAAAVALRPLKKDPTQLWQPEAQDVTPGDVFTLHPKISDDESRLTGVLELQDPDNRFSDSPAYQAEHNRLTVGYYSNENTEYWIIKQVPGGKFRIMSMLAAAASLNEPGAEPFPTRWNEERSLAAVKGADGSFVVRHEPSASTPAQLWTITAAGD